MKDHEPDFVVREGWFEIGVAWKQSTQEGDGEYLSVVLDDPHFDHEIRARPVRHEDKYILLWERLE